ncbi:MAG: GGDEF domain-containing protein [Lachnospiraceae bacterium]|nr:GGDEF domain-containing protein [Lachnospiraceae bacterium]
MKKTTDGLLFKFSILFVIFTVVTLILCAITTYFSQMNTYTQECRDSIREVGDYLESLILADGDDFITYQNYFMNHYKTSEIPFDFNEYITAQSEYEELFAKNYPGKTLWKDLEFEDMAPDVQEAYFKFTHEYWLLAFENSRASFDLPYTYYIVPVETNSTPGQEEYDIYYMIDGERTAKEDSDGKYLYLGDQYHHTPAEQPVEWKVWSTGKRTDEFQEWDNNYGHTYTYYIPLIIDGQKLGLIGTEIEVAKVNRGILLNTLRQTVEIGIVLVICVFFMLMFINRKYIKIIVRLSDNVRQYSRDKDPSIAQVIELDGNTGDEISSLANQTAAMVMELENYMKSLVATTKELTETRQQADDMKVLATKDALTGIRNKTAYDSEIKQLEWMLSDGMKDFGLAMIDLNFLKRINDTFGHEQGNVAIRKLCNIVCHVFQHSPVFRIGGDEFAVILKGNDFEHRDELVEEFNHRLDELAEDSSLAQWEKVSAAIGVAVFDPEKDSSVDNVFKRADNAMYERKKEMKASRE